MTVLQGLHIIFNEYINIYSSAAEEDRVVIPRRSA